MKKENLIIKFLSYLSVVMILAGMALPPWLNGKVWKNASEFYQTPHRLRTMFTENKESVITTPAKGHVSGNFFVFTGGLDGDYTGGTVEKVAVTQIRFGWETKDGVYVITTIPFEKVRIRLVDKLDAPSVSFVLSRSPDDLHSSKKLGKKTSHINWNDYNNPEPIFAQYLAYAIFTVKVGDWPSDIRLPLEKN
jgi:hypothetical protein